MKTIQKTHLSLLLIVFLITAACNAPAVLGEVSSPPAEAPAGEDLTFSPTPPLPDTSSDTDEAAPPSDQPMVSGTVVFTAEPVEAAGETHQPINAVESAAPEIPAPKNTLSFSADASAAPNDAPENQPDLPIELSDSGAGCEVKGNFTFEEILLHLINQERANQGLNQLVFDPLLIDTARLHSLDMACQNYFDHTGSDGSSPFKRIGASGYPYEAAGENIYAGSGPYNCAQEAFKAWMKSPAHQKVMLNENFEEIGIGYVFNADSTYGGYFTAVFASR